MIQNLKIGLNGQQKVLVKSFELGFGFKSFEVLKKVYFKLIKFVCTQISLTYFQTMYFPFFLKKNYPTKNHYIIYDDNFNNPSFNIYHTSSNHKTQISKPKLKTQYSQNIYCSTQITHINMVACEYIIIMFTSIHPFHV